MGTGPITLVIFQGKFAGRVPSRYVFRVGFTSVAAAILAAVEGGILPPGPEVRNGSDFSNHTPIPPGRMPGSTAGKMPAATLTRTLADRSHLPDCFPVNRVCLWPGWPLADCQKDAPNALYRTAGRSASIHNSERRIISTRLVRHADATGRDADAIDFFRAS
jgi:hypothetical protein